ncbi:MAG TPA: Rrf2 family transcriptional regulator [Chthonomonadaceae bacterium]|nr:Rrf2 family transcriptional regulator [Chthonomonadaceae bacterium]
MFSQTAEYALRAIVHLANESGGPRTARQIAEATQVPVPYLLKILHGLTRAGLIDSQRGLHGGFTLRKPAAALTLYEIVQSVDPLQRICWCPLGIRSHGASLCPLHRRLDDAVGLVENALRATTVAELLEENTGSKPLCDVAALAGREKIQV